MEIQVQPTITMNVGDASSTASSAITYTAYESVPVNPVLGDFRMVPNRVLGDGAGTIEFYNADSKVWITGEATIYDRTLGAELIAKGFPGNNYVYYRLNINDTSPGKVVEGDTRKPSFAIDVTPGE